MSNLPNALTSSHPAGTAFDITRADGSVERVLVQQGVTGSGLIAQPARLQGTILIDPQNVSRIASDTAPPTATVAGFTGSVFRSYRGLVTAWGTTSPLLTQSTTIVFVSSHTDDSDPVVFTPIVANGAAVVLQGVTQQVAAVNAASVVARVRGGPGQLTNVKLGTGPAVGQLFVNSQAGKSSRAWLFSLVSGTTFALSQPLAPMNPTGAFAFPAEVTTIANGDSVGVFTLTAINLVSVAPTVSVVGGSGFGVVIYNCTVLSPGGVGAQQLNLGINAVLYECLVNRVVNLNGAGFDSLMMNCNLQGGINGGETSQGSYFIVGGILQGPIEGTAQNMLLDGDVILAATTNIFGTGPNGTTYGLVYIATGVVLTLSGYALGFSNYGTNVQVIWGGGTLDIIGRVTYQGQTAVATFLQQGGLQMNGGTVASSASIANPSVINTNVPLTPANLDAAQGATGFGGQAFNLFSGASLTTSGQL